MPKVSSKRQSRKSRRSATRNLPLVTYVPSSKSITMSYATATTLAESAAGVGVTWLYRLNSVFDPDFSGVGTSAIGYSTWSALFGSYKVRRATVRLQGTVNGMAAGGLATVVLAPLAGGSVVPSNKQTWKMMRGATMHIATNQSLGGNNTSFEITRTFDLPWAAAVTKAQYDNDMDFSGAVGSNPARAVYVVLGLDSAGSASVVTMTYNLQITYLVEWFNPIPMQ